MKCSASLRKGSVSGIIAGERRLFRRLTGGIYLGSVYRLADRWRAVEESWAFTTLGVLGNDDTARKLTPLIRAWPGESQHKRATVGLDILAAIGSDIALMQLNGIAQKLKFKALQERAKEKIADIAEGRELTVAELEDRLAPDLGLDDNGSLLLDFGLAGIRPAGEHCGIALDDQLLASLPSEDVRAAFALSPQDAQLLSGTIRDNLRVARPGLSDERLWAALEVACLAVDIRAMPHGLDQWVGDGGARLSGGQRKRSIARALLAGRPWLLLDEPSEGLDMATEARLAGHLGVASRDRDQVVVVSHRPIFLEVSSARVEQST